MSRKALIVEDSIVTRRIITLLLSIHNYDTQESENGLIALSALRNNPSFEFILVDLNMPEMNGLELISKVRALPKLKDTKLFVVTANDTERAARSALDRGADDFIPKPISNEKIATLLRKHGLN